MSVSSVLHLIRPQPPGEVGGADLHVVDLASEQLLAGVDVTVAHFGNPEYAALLRSRGIPEVGVYSGGLRTWFRTVRDHLARTGAELVHSHGYESDYVATALRLRPGRTSRVGRTFVISSHGFIRTGIRLRAMTLLNERCLSGADAIITASRPEEARLKALGYRDVQYVANGVVAAPAEQRAYVTKEL